MKKRNIIRALSALALWSSLTFTATAQTAVEDPNGFRTVVPAGYTVRQEAAGTAATNAAGTTLLAITAHTYRNFEAFAADANLARDGFTLNGEPRLLERGDGIHFRASKPNPQGGTLVADTFVTFLPQGGGVLVVALSDLNSADAGYHAGHDITSRIEFFQPRATAQSSAWDQALRGKHLVYLYTGNGYSERKDLYLFANGTFSQRMNMSSVSINGSGGGAGGSDGAWRVTPAGQLVLSFHDGRSASYSLAPRQARNEVALNGQRYFVLAD